MLGIVLGMEIIMVNEIYGFFFYGVYNIVREVDIKISNK